MGEFSEPVGFGPRLRARRLARGLTQEAIAHELGVTRATVSRWESSLNAPEFQLLEPLRRLLDTSLDHLVGGEPLPGRRVGESPAVYAGIDPLTARIIALVAHLSRRRKIAVVTLLAPDRPEAKA